MLGRPIFTGRARITLRCLMCALAVMLVAGGCARRTAARLPARIGSTETGVASWYGVPYHGRPTASGEIFDMEQVTAAHRTLPFQTWVEITNLSNGKQVNVRIIDRGPFVHGRIIDLSMAAARQIDMVREGTARVRLKVIEPPITAAPAIPPPVNALGTPQTDAGYAVQAGAFSDPSRAEAFRATLPYADARVEEPHGNPVLWRVLIGHGLTAEAANVLAAEVRKTAGAAMVVKEHSPE